MTPELNQAIINWLSMSIFMMKGIVVVYLLYGFILIVSLLRD